MLNFLQNMLKKKNEPSPEEEQYKDSCIEITPKDSIYEYPLGELLGKAATSKSQWNNKNTMFCTSSLTDIESLLGIMMQSVKKGHSIVFVDVDNQMYQKTWRFLKGNGYHIKALDIDNEDTFTWSIFEEMTDIYSIADKSRQLIDIMKWNLLPREKAVNEEYTNGLSVTLAAVLAYVLSDNLLAPNKFQIAYELLNHNTTKNLDNYFSVAEDTPKTLWFNFRNDYIEDYIKDLLRLFNILRDNDRNRLINDENINISRLRIRKTVYFLNFIGDNVEDNVPLNIFLNFVLQKAISMERQYNEMKMNGTLPDNKAPLIPVDFFIMDMDVHPDLNQFIYAMRHDGGDYHINLFLTCVDASYMYANYYMVADELSEILQYTIVQTNDRTNRESLEDMLNVDDIPFLDIDDEEEVIICRKQEFVLCAKYHVRNHPLYPLLIRK